MNGGRHDRLWATTTAFSQGELQDFRQRLIRTEMDHRILERTVELARQTQEIDWKKLPGAVRVAMDSSPLIGAGRVEDTINLLAHAARDVVVCNATSLTSCSLKQWRGSYSASPSAMAC